MYGSPGDGIPFRERWSFESIATQFDSHVEKSVPGYRGFHEWGLRLANFLLPPDSRVVDIGCSTGVFTKLLGTADNVREVVGIDIEPTMIEEAERRFGHLQHLKFMTADCQGFDYRETQAVFSLFSLQFLAIEDRQGLLKRISEELPEGGFLYLVEKVEPASELQPNLLREFKRANGFTAAEIASKELSLDGILIPFSRQEKTELLRSEFSQVETVLKSLQFEAILAIK